MSDQKRKLTALARVAFLPEAQGGHETPPRERYIAPAQFEGADTPWSLAARFVEPLSADKRTTLAFVDFVVEDAPHDLLVRDATFEWLEGPEVVAQGRVLRSSAYVSDSELVDSEDGNIPRHEAEAA